jgi:acyl-CoA reductase-like NAD-dependent aldehyde dehydrogenase
MQSVQQHSSRLGPEIPVGDPYRRHRRAQFGGMKQSGIGGECGHHGMLDYPESKYIAVQW